MQNVEELRSLSVTFSWMSLVFYAVLLVAFLIGLYGMFSLIWLESDSLAHSARVVSTIF
jgi:hypothetical protein